MKGKRNHIIILLALMVVMIMMTTVSVSAAGNSGMKKDFKSVTVTPMHNGYCSLSFSVPGTTKEIFVTGIREDKAEKIKARVTKLEDGTVVYKVGFTSGDKYYSVKVNALTGAVVDKTVQSAAAFRVKSTAPGSSVMFR